MATHLQKLPILHFDSLTILWPFPSNPNTSLTKISLSFPCHNFRTRLRHGCNGCAARRRVRYDNDKDKDEDYGHNDQIALLESYTQAATGEALIVHAAVDGDHVEVLVFKVFLTLFLCLIWLQVYFRLNLNFDLINS